MVIVPDNRSQHLQKHDFTFATNDWNTVDCLKQNQIVPGMFEVHSPEKHDKFGKRSGLNYILFEKLPN